MYEHIFTIFFPSCLEYRPKCIWKRTFGVLKFIIVRLLFIRSCRYSQKRAKIVKSKYMFYISLIEINLNNFLTCNTRKTCFSRKNNLSSCLPDYITHILTWRLKHIYTYKTLISAVEGQVWNRGPGGILCQSQTATEGNNFWFTTK